MSLVVIASLEGVLADNSHRQHLFRAGQWDDYEAACVDDVPYAGTVEAVNLMLHGNYRFVITTVRYQRWEFQTNAWLSKHEIYPDWVMFRDKYDIPKTKEPILKMGYFEEIRRNYCDGQHFLVLEHRDDVVEAYRNAGIECWQIRNGVLS